jgi:hypothetical protein
VSTKILKGILAQAVGVIEKYSIEIDLVLKDMIKSSKGKIVPRTIPISKSATKKSKLLLREDLEIHLMSSTEALILYGSPFIKAQTHIEELMKDIYTTLDKTSVLPLSGSLPLSLLTRKRR